MSTANEDVNRQTFNYEQQYISQAFTMCPRCGQAVAGNAMHICRYEEVSTAPPKFWTIR
jgi:hypothetical protein